MRNKETLRKHKCDELKFKELLQIKELIYEEFDILVIKIPHLPYPVKIFDTPGLQNDTVNIIDSYFSTTLIPIFIITSSFEANLSDGYIDSLGKIKSHFEGSYFYLIITKINLLSEDVNDMNLFKTNLNNILNYTEQIDLKLIGLNSMVDNNYTSYIKYLKDFNDNYLALFKMDYFKSLIRSCIKNFSQAISYNNYDSKLQFNSFPKQSYDEQFDRKLESFFNSIPKTSNEIIKNFSYWYDNLYKYLKENLDKKLKNKNYMNKNSYNTEQIDYVKPYFNCLLTEKIKSFVKEIIPTIIFPEYSIEFFIEESIISRNKNIFENEIGEWSKSAIFDIILKLFEMLSQNKDKIMIKCKNLFHIYLNFNKIKDEPNPSYIIKTILKIIDSQQILNRNIKVYTLREALKQILNKKNHDLEIKLRKILKII